MPKKLVKTRKLTLHQSKDWTFRPYKPGHYKIIMTLNGGKVLTRGPYTTWEAASKRATELLWTNPVRAVRIVKIVLAEESHGSWERG